MKTESAAGILFLFFAPGSAFMHAQHDALGVGIPGCPGGLLLYLNPGLYLYCFDVALGLNVVLYEVAHVVSPVYF